MVCIAGVVANRGIAPHPLWLALLVWLVQTKGLHDTNCCDSCRAKAACVFVTAMLVAICRGME